MSSTHEVKPAGKSGRRTRKGEARRPKENAPHPTVEMRSIESEPPTQPEPTMNVTVESEPVVIETALPDPAPVSQPLPAEAPPVSLQIIANAYRDYTRRSFEAFGSFCEQLTGVRSLNKALEVQTEFLKLAYEHSMTESRNIRELHRKLARQTFAPFVGFYGKALDISSKP